MQEKKSLARVVAEGLFQTAERGNADDRGYPENLELANTPNQHDDGEISARDVFEMKAEQAVCPCPQATRGLNLCAR